MRLGALRKRVTLQAESLVPDGAGGLAASWADVANLWAELAPVDSGRTLVSSAVDLRITHRMTLRYRSDVVVTAGMRLVLGSRIFAIRVVVNRDESNRWWDVLAEEGGRLG